MIIKKLKNSFSKYLNVFSFHVLQFFRQKVETTELKKKNPPQHFNTGDARCITGPFCHLVVFYLILDGYWMNSEDYLQRLIG